MAALSVVSSGKIVVGVTLLAAAMLAAAAQSPADPEGPWRPEIPRGLDLYLPVPEDNPLTPEKVALGRRLFFDPILSRDYTLACASCHDPRRAFADGFAVAVGVANRHGTRNAPAIFNRARGWGQRTAAVPAPLSPA